jgi:hypothetical protein
MSLKRSRTDLSAKNGLVDVPADVLALILKNLMMKDLTKVFLVSKDWSDAFTDAASQLYGRSFAAPLVYVEQAKMLFPHAKIVPILEYWDAAHIWLHNRNFNGFKEFLYYDPKRQNWRKDHTSGRDTNSTYFPFDGFEHLWSENIHGRKMLRVRKID